MEKSSIISNRCRARNSSASFFAESSRATFFQSFIQPKLTINPPNDEYEQEADAVADKVMRMKDHTAENNFFFKPAISPIQRKCAHCEEETELQRKERNSAETTTKSELNAYVSKLPGGGQPLSKEVRHFFEPKIGHDFSAVKVHTDPDAAKSAQSINALAYTVGNNIVFNKEQYAPDTNSGKRLLGHELTHVVQQTKAPGGVVQRRTARSSYVTAAFLPGPLWNVTLVITGAPDTPTEAFDDFENACMEGIRAAANALGNGSSAVSRRMTVRLRYRRRFDYAAIEQEAYQQALHAVLPPPAPAPAPVPVVPPAPAPVVTPAPAPAVTTSRAGTDFDQFMARVTLLETAAINDGYSLTQRITAFRKIFYDSANAARTYAGATVGGGAWNILIPGAASTQLPPSWASQQNLIDAKAYLAAHQSITAQPHGTVDVGHLFAGLDAGQHPTNISIGFGQIQFRSNKEASTFIGDLGSVVVEYIKANNASFRDVAMVRNNTILNTQYAGFASDPDMAGNVDAYALTLDPSKSIAQNLIDYYTPASGGYNRRYTAFANSIGLGTLTNGVFSGDSPALRTALTDEVFAGALAYAAANGRRVDVVNVINDPGPGIFVPTFWEMYFNISGWVVDKFIQTVAAKVAAE